MLRIWALPASRVLGIGVLWSDMWLRRLFLLLCGDRMKEGGTELMEPVGRY